MSSSTARENQAISPSTGAQSPDCAMLYCFLDAQLSCSSTVRTSQRIYCLMPDWRFHSSMLNCLVHQHFVPHREHTVLCQTDVSTAFMFRVKGFRIFTRSVLIFSTIFASNFLIIKKWARHDQNYTGLHVKYRPSCQILMELEFPRQIYPNILK